MCTMLYPTMVCITYRLSIIANIKLSLQNILFSGERRSMEKNVDSIHFQHFSPFFIICIANLLMCTLFEGEGSEKVYVLYTNLNVDNYGQPLRFIGDTA